MTSTSIHLQPDATLSAVKLALDDGREYIAIHLIGADHLSIFLDRVDAATVIHARAFAEQLQAVAAVLITEAQAIDDKLAGAAAIEALIDADAEVLL